MAITVTTTKVIADESTGTQTNGSAGADATGNEFTFGAAGAPTVPSAFSSALVDVAAGLPTTGALSGFSTSATTGLNVIDYGGATVSGAAFVGSNGLPLNGVDSGLQTTDGTSIFLYTYSLDNNVLFGVKGNVNPEDDVANPPVVFAAYLQETSTGIKVWLVQYESIFNDTLAGSTAAAYDDAVTPDNVIFVALNQNTQFSLAGAPSGQNVFLMYGTPDDGNAGNGDEVALVVTASNVASGGTVNTGQGGGGTTIGSNNQMLDAGEALKFTFVTNADPNFTVPNLSAGEAGNADNIQFDGLFSSLSASFTVVQTQPASKSGTLTIKAFTTDVENDATGPNTFINGYGDDVEINITSVVIKDAAGNTVNLSVDLSALGATIVGVKAGYTITYTTASAHQRAEISNTGVENTKTGADFDIGGFSLPSTTTTQLPFTALEFQDDGLSAAGTAQSSEVDEDGLPGGNTTTGLGDLDADDGVNDDDDGDETTASGNVSGIFVAGADGIASYGFSSDAAAIAALPTLTSKGEAVAYDVTGTLLTAYVDSGSVDDSLDGDDRKVFTMSITAATGAYSFSLLDQLDHPLVNDPGTGAAETSFEDNLNLQLGSIVQAKDGDNDTATASAEKLVITVDDDSPDPLTPDALTVHNAVSATASAALGSFGNVGADEEGSAVFVGEDGTLLTGDIIGNGISAPENILANGANIYLFGFNSATLVATTDSTNTDTDSRVFVMTLNPDGSVEANDLYDITMLQAVANLQDVPFGSFTAAPSSGNPLTLVVNDIGGSTVDAFFSGWLDVGPSAAPNSTSQTTVNVATVGVGVGTGQDFNFDANGAGTADDVSDRIRIEFLEDDGDKALEAGEATTVNRFTYVMNQNNSPADDGDMLVRVYDIAGNEVQITGILINGSTLVGSGGAPVASNDGGNVTATASGLGFILRGLGGGTGGSTADNDTVTIITTAGYARIDMTGIGADNSKDTFDILLQSLAVPTARDVTFTVQAALADEDTDTSAAANLVVTLDADGVFVTTVGTGGVDPII